MSYRIVVPVEGSGGFINGVSVDAWEVSRFADANVPAKDSAPPSGSPDAGPVTTATNGAPGQAVLDVPAGFTYNVRVQQGGHSYWTQTSEALGVKTFQGRTAAAATMTKADVTGTGLTYSDVGADASGAAATVQGNLNTEASTRASADTTLQTNINTEAASRVAGDALAAKKASNLSDLASASTARTNLGLGDAATHPASDFSGSPAGTAGKPLAATDLTTTNSRTPTAHASSHASAGTDPITIAESQVTGLVADLAAKAPLASPALTGSPTAPTQAAGDNSTKLSTTAYADSAVGVETSRATTAEAILAPKASPALTGSPTAPTQAAADNSTKIATTSYVDNLAPGSRGRAVIAGLRGANGVTSGQLVSGTRYGAVDMIIGDSTSRGDGGTFGSTDWGTVLANTENLAAGLPPAGIGMNVPTDSIDSVAWTNLTSGAVVSTVATYGPSVAACSWLLSSAGHNISDTKSFRRVKAAYLTQPNGAGITFAVTGGSAPSATVQTDLRVASATINNSASVTVASGGFPNVQIGDIVTIISGSGAIPANTTVLRIGDPTTGDPNTLVLSAATTGGSNVVTLGFSGFRLWDSGDLGSVAGTALTATYAAQSVGTGAAGSVVVGARYYQTDGTKGVVIDNFGVGGTTSNQWAAVTPGSQGWGWTAWLAMNYALGTPIRRLYVCMGINDPAWNFTSAQYATNLGAICDAAATASPTTEVVIIGQWYGDVGTIMPNVVVTSGVNTIYSTSGAIYDAGPLGGVKVPLVGSVVGGVPGLYVGTTVTAVAGPSTAITPTATCSTSGTAMTAASGTFTSANGFVTGMVVTGPGISGVVTITVNSSSSITLSASAGSNTSQTYTFYGAATITSSFGAPAGSATGNLCVTQIRGGATKWRGWVDQAAKTASTKGATFINLYDRFGDLSIQGTVTTAITQNKSCVLTGGKQFPNAVAGQAISGNNIQPGTTIISYTPGALTLTMSQPATADGSNVQVWYGGDLYGLTQKTVRGLHIGDASQSISGLDGQEAMAGYIMGRLMSQRGTAYAAGSDTAGVAGNVSLLANGAYAQTFVSGTARQISTVSDAMLYLGMGTSATALKVTMGPTTGAEISVSDMASTATQRSMSCRVPAGWYVIVTATMANLNVSAAVPC